MPSPEPTPNSTKPTQTVAIQVAARLLAEGQFSKAIRQLEVLSNAMPAYVAGQVLLAKAYEAEQQWNDALNAWHRAYFLAPSSPLVQRERRRLLDGQTEAAATQLHAEPPPIPEGQVSELRADEVEEQVVANLDGVHDLVATTSEEQEVEEQEVEEQEVEEPEEVLAVAEDDPADEVPEPPETDDLHDSEPEDDLPEVFVQDSVPVSDALGKGVTVEMWDDDETHADVKSRVEEPIVSAPEIDDGPGEPIPRESDGYAARWKQSKTPDETNSSDDAEAGWAVLSEMEAERTDEVATEARIAAPEPDVPTNAKEGSEEATLADNLDSLIQQLEDAPRIRPDPNFTADDEPLDDDEADDMVSETLARIYVAQGQYKEAADVYEKLAEQHPEQAADFNEKAEDLRIRGSRSS